MPEVRDWGAMRASIRELLVRRTGEDLPEWNARVRRSGAKDEAALKAWLTRQGVVGYPRMLLIMERFGYPEFMTASSEDLLDGQYGGAPELRAVYDELIRRTRSLGQVTVQARKTYVSLLTPRRTFARVQPIRKEAIAVALRLDARPIGRLLPSKVHESMPVQVVLRSKRDLDAEALRLLRRAYEQCV